MELTLDFQLNQSTIQLCGPFRNQSSKAPVNSLGTLSDGVADGVSRMASSRECPSAPADRSLGLAQPGLRRATGKDGWERNEIGESLEITMIEHANL